MWALCELNARELTDWNWVMTINFERGPFLRDPKEGVFSQDLPIWSCTAWNHIWSATKMAGVLPSPIVTNAAIENGHGNSKLSCLKLWFSIVMFVYHSQASCGTKPAVECADFWSSACKQPWISGFCIRLKGVIYETKSHLRKVIWN